MYFRRHLYAVFAGLAIGLIVSLFAGVALGTVPLPVTDVLRVLFFQAATTENTQIIIESIRLPRVLLAAVVGACLAMCGAVSQSLFRNPLADPSLIGVTAGASLGGCLVIFSGFTVLNAGAGIHLSLVALGAFLGGGLTAILVYKLATNEFGTSVVVMLLAGVAVSALVGSMTHLLEYFSDDMTLRRISLWTMGGLDAANPLRIGIASIVLVVLFVYLYKVSQPLNALLLGESEARHLGVDVVRLKRRIILLISVGVGCSVAVAGTIAFVGLVVPHFMRLLLGPNHRVLIPASLIAGAILLVVADILARVVLAPSELPVGLVTALVGAPVFISLLQYRRRYGF